ncbi:MAG: Eco57I restriction-modification methylase domain-containing protein [Atopobium sp.]|nr:Eco57I restriction-modification methylase domain-containing protein [Atopobium sp.]
MGDDEITVEKITGLSSGVIKPRIAKEQEHQSKRTKSRAEVFTPSWLCNQMNNDIDAAWFGARDVFNVEDNQAWHTGQEPIIFPKKKGYGWRAYIESPRLEITCGEAPFVCSRYDTVTGEILPVDKRIGFLDRKFRVVSEKTKTRKEWVRWAFAALKASYGFEYQGDNLFLARINVFETFCEHLCARWGAGIADEELDQAAWIVSWNFWQMNGLTRAVPTNKIDTIVQSAFFEYKEPILEPIQSSIFDLLDDSPSDESIGKTKMDTSEEMVPFCVIYNWKENKPLEFVSLKGKACPMKKFYAVIGNPPYQEEFSDEGNKTYAKPVYNDFMDSAEEIADRVELITPARFLFNAGSTPKAWNAKKLSDPHFTVLQYEADASKIFPNTDIKGGVAVSLHDGTRTLDPIGTYIPYNILRSIWEKVTKCGDFISFDGIVRTAYAYHFTDTLHDENPDAKECMSKGHAYDLKSNVLEKLPDIFYEKKPNDGHEYIKVLGLVKMKRIYRYVRRDYVNEPENLLKWKVFVPAANGSGALGEVLSTPLIGQPLIGQPLIGHTETFMSIGCFDTEGEAQALLKYVRSKFARALLGILKTTQHNPPEKWRFIPLQNFTQASDIDWSKSIPEIDQQLYAKYGLSDEEIDFIESHVKEMN